jgi:hypothetical protein
MDVILRPLFSVLNVPELKLKKPGWIQQPAPYTVFALVLLSYFLVTGWSGSSSQRPTYNVFALVLLSYFLVTGRSGSSSQRPTPSLLLYSSPTSWSQVGQDPAASALYHLCSATSLLLLGHR